MALLRFISFSLISFLLLEPILQYIFTKTEKPVVVVALDNSQSILLSKDSSSYKNKLPQELKDLTDKLSDQFEVHLTSFSGQLEEINKTFFTGNSTNISNAFDAIYDNYYNQNLGAIVLLSDGIYNEGENPYYNISKINAPIYTIGLGDTTPHKDLIIKEVLTNEVAYLGNSFPVKISLKSNGFKNKEMKVTISQNGEILYNQNIAIQQEHFYKEIECKLEAKKSGKQRYRVKIEPLSDEISYQNNVKDFYIDILDSKRKILLLSHAPHPDIAAIRKSIERNAFYEVQSFLYSDFNRQNLVSSEKLKNYQLVILHQLPASGENISALLSTLESLKMSVLYVLGQSSDLNAFNNQNTGVRITGSGGRINEVQGSLNESFNYFNVAPIHDKTYDALPPIYAPFGDYKTDDELGIILYQKLGQVKTRYPLLYFGNVEGRKTSVLTGEGIWKWFVASYGNDLNFDLPDFFIDKTVQYLSLKTDSRLFRIYPTKSQYFEGERIQFRAEVYNKSYEFVKNALVQLSIKNEEGKKYDYNLLEADSSYSLDAGSFPAGVYTYTGKCNTGGKAYTISGEFLVKRIDLEFAETVADHQLLSNISHKTGGQFLNYHQLNQLSELLKTRDDLKPISYQENEVKQLIDFKWLFFILLLLLGTEWFLRKYYGSA